MRKSLPALMLWLTFALPALAVDYPVPADPTTSQPTFLVDPATGQALPGQRTGPVALNTGINGGAIGTAQSSQLAIPNNLNRIGATIQNPGTSGGQGLARCLGAVISASGTGYSPGDTVTLAGGVQTQRCVLLITNTRVSNLTLPTVVSGGTGCTPNSNALLAGTTGVTSTGGFFQLVGNISAGGVLTAVLSVNYGGFYTTNPTTLTAEPVTTVGCSVNPTVNLGMGAALATVQTGGRYSNPLPDPIFDAPLAEFSSSGGGTGNTWKTSFGGNPYYLFVAVGRAATVAGLNYRNLAPGGSTDLDVDGHVWQGDIFVNSLAAGHVFNSTEWVKP